MIVAVVTFSSPEYNKAADKIAVGLRQNPSSSQWPQGRIRISVLGAMRLSLKAVRLVIMRLTHHSQRLAVPYKTSQIRDVVEGWQLLELYKTFKALPVSTASI